ncbi:MAG: hypothetical protein EAZ30_02940 [Betaproteobacteria bacterium]|nr:MAG: hypothetical protein EAZ30_02940 [Betaproteobacteria bacterium]
MQTINPFYNALPEQKQQHPLYAEQLLNALQKSNKLHWHSTLVLWLSRFAGLECFIRLVDQTPRESLLVTVAQRSFAQSSDDATAAILSQLDFLTLRARSDNKFWDFRQTSFLAFYEDGKTAVWQSDREWPEAQQTAEWLLDTLKTLRPLACV